jgi:RecA-family ATPase
MRGPKDITEAGGLMGGDVVPYQLPGSLPLPRFLRELGEDPLAVEPPPRTFLLARPSDGGFVGWLPSGEVAMLAAGGGVGKTTLACQLALAVATGGPFCGMRVVRPGSVLLALGEEDEEEMRRKLHLTSRAMQLDVALRATAASRIALLPLVGQSARLLVGERGRFTPAPLLEALRSYLATNASDWRLVVVDPFSRFCAPEAETDNAVASETVQAMASLAKVPGAPTVLVLHHVNKEARAGGPPNVNAVRGAGALTDESRWAAVMWQDEHDAMTVHLAVRKSNYAQPGPSIVLRRERGGVLRLASPAERAAVERS